MGRNIAAQQAVPTYKGESGQISSYKKVEEKNRKGAVAKLCLLHRKVDKFQNVHVCKSGDYIKI